jgi:hypothetical protein
VVALLFAVAVAAGPSPTPAASATPRQVLREIGHVKARTPYCTAFETHFNASARALLEHDVSISLVDYTYGDVTKTFDELGGDLQRSDDRRKLAAYADQLSKQIPEAQAEVDALRRAASLAADPAVAQDDRDLAKQMQAALDRQKQIAIDATGVVRALMEYDSGLKSAASSHLPGSYDDDKSAKPADMLDVRKYVRIQELRDRIGDAESASAGIADTIEDRCR